MSQAGFHSPWNPVGSISLPDSQGFFDWAASEWPADRFKIQLERLAPMWIVLRDAASVDPRAAATMHAMLEHRAASFEVAIDMLPEHRLRESPSQSVDTLP